MKLEEELRTSLHKYFLAQTGGLDRKGETTPEGRIFSADYIKTLMAPYLEQVARHELNAVMFLLPVRHCKTWLCTKHFIPWVMGNWPSRSNLLLSYSDPFAKRYGRNILDKINTPLHQRLFPENKISKFAKSGTYFEIPGGGHFVSAGFDGAVTGMGFDGVILIDDPLKNIDDARSVAHEQTLMDVYQSTVKTRMEGAGRVMATTRWCRGDFVERVLDEEGRAEEGGAWTVVRLPAQAEENDPAGRLPGDYLWPERWTAEWYEDHKKGRFWGALFQQDPQMAGGKRFQRAWLQYYKEWIRPGKFKTYMTVDPAKGQERQHNRTSITVWAALPGGKLALVDWALGRFDPDERSDQFIRLWRKWQPARVVWEEYAAAYDSWYLKRRMKDLGMSNVENRIKSVGRRGEVGKLSKDERIDKLIPMFREGQIWLPEEGSPNRRQMLTHENDEPFDPVEYLVEQEIVEWEGEGSVPTDDGLDSFAWLTAPELGIVYPRDQVERDLPYMQPYNAKASTRKGGWEARW